MFPFACVASWFIEESQRAAFNVEVFPLNPFFPHPCFLSSFKHCSYPNPHLLLQPRQPPLKSQFITLFLTFKELFKDHHGGFTSPFMILLSDLVFFDPITSVAMVNEGLGLLFVRKNPYCACIYGY
ncbi:hypothetical protein V6N13_042532 [Hibiscus sabdariffa]|uniref:Uncharacterized protein n=1 Tax=Hibiscus sabdariffa TaxID=183260 RepID=A0ABR1Z9U4_9ROSI